MINANKINELIINSSLQIEHVNVTNLLFNSGKVVSKSRYSIENNILELFDESETFLALYQNINSSRYFEYDVRLSDIRNKLSGYDKFGRSLDLSDNTVLVFINGIKLSPDSYTLDRTNNCIIFKSGYKNASDNNVIVYTSDDIVYEGSVRNYSTWNASDNSFLLSDFFQYRYAFFKNGKMIDRKDVINNNGNVKLNIIIDEEDVVESCRFPANTSCLYFESGLGYFTFGPRDDYDQLIPDSYDTIVTFDDVPRLLIDNLRKGFLIRERGTNGLLVVADTEFENRSIKCIAYNNFVKDYLTSKEFFMQVPEATSILNYVSSFDMKGTLFPELLSIFQGVLLNETYDSIQRLKDIRNIDRVDSSNINRLITMLGLTIKTTDMSIRKRRNLLEELRSFYSIVGTKASLNFYNAVIEDGKKVLSIEQLFTPIADSIDNKRYITFKTIEELAGSSALKREYVIPKEDYGYVDSIANTNESLTNSPRSEGVLRDSDIPVANFTDYIDVYVIDENGDFVKVRKKANKNFYLELPVSGPNSPTVDYGYIDDDPTSFYDNGSVADRIKGHWNEWYEWDRPEGWYPTNHVEVTLETPLDMDYNEFINEFTKTFYNIASTVLYLHGIVQAFTFGTEGKQPYFDEFERSDCQFNLLSAPNYEYEERCFSNDPARQSGAFKEVKQTGIRVVDKSLEYVPGETEGYIHAKFIIERTYDNGLVDVLTHERDFPCTWQSLTVWEHEQKHADVITTYESPLARVVSNKDEVYTQRTPVMASGGFETTRFSPLETWECFYTIFETKTVAKLENGVEKLNKIKYVLPTYIQLNVNGYSFDFYGNDSKGNHKKLEWKFDNKGQTLDEIDVDSNETTNIKVTKTTWKYTNSIEVSALKPNSMSLAYNLQFMASSNGILTTTKEIIILDVDYMVIKYRWKSGKDLDSDTKIVNALSSILQNLAVGYSRGSVVPRNARFDDCALYWGGDNTGEASETNPQEENILINITNLKEKYNDDLPEIVNIDLSATWYSRVGNNPEVEVSAYKGGTMNQSGYRFVNVGGELKFEKTLVVENMSQTLKTYTNVANVTVNKDTKAVTLEIVVQE